MNTYHTFYKGKRLELKSETSYKAQLAAAQQFKAKKSWEVNVVLVAVAGKQIEHIADF